MLADTKKGIEILDFKTDRKYNLLHKHLLRKNKQVLKNKICVLQKNEELILGINKKKFVYFH